jgi:hypothetical protein
MQNLVSLEVAYFAEARARWDMVIPTPQDLFTTLQSCPNLEKLVCTGAAGEMWANCSPFSEPIEMNRLRILEFTGMQTPIGLSKVIPFIIAPNLRRLHLEMRTVDDESLPANYACPPIPSNETIHSLSLSGWFPLRVVLAMLPRMKNVEALHLEGNPWTGGILERIVDEGYLPRLKKVALERADQFESALMRLGEDRSCHRHGVASTEHLRYVHILYRASDGYPDVDRRRLERNVEKVVIERTWS